MKSAIVTPGTTINVLKLIDIERDGRGGVWHWDERRRLAGANWRIIRLPVNVPAEYDLALTLEGHPVAFPIAVWPTVGGRRVNAIIDTGGPVSGLALIDGKGVDANETTHRGRVLVDGQPNKLVYQVRSRSIKVLCNGTMVIDWQGEPSRLSFQGDSVAGLDGLAIFGWDGHGCGWTLSQIDLTPVNPSGEISESAASIRPSLRHDQGESGVPAGAKKAAEVATPSVNSKAIAARLTKAKADYRREMQSICDSWEAYLDKRLQSGATVTAKRNLAQVRAAFDQDGRLPKSAPIGFRQRAAKGHAELEKAYRSAIAECAAANRTEQAAQLEDELKRLGEADLLGRFRRELLHNGGCEQPLDNGVIPGWTVVSGKWRPQQKDPPPQEGSSYFLPGDCGEGELRQDVNVDLYADAIDAGAQRFEFKGFVRSFAQDPPDTSQVVIEYRDQSNSRILDTFDSGAMGVVSAWTLVTDKRLAPRDTRWVRVRLISRRYGRGTRDNDGYYDGLSLRVVDK